MRHEEIEIIALEQKIKDIQDQAKVQDRELNKVEQSLCTEMSSAIKDLRMSLPGPVLTLQGFGGDASTSARPYVTNPRSFKAMFYPDKPNSKLDDGGFKNAGEFLRVLDSGRYDPRLQNAMVEGIPSSGGFSVPQQFSSEWLDASLPNEIVRPLCKVYPMTSSEKLIPGWDAADMSAGACFGGFAMDFLAESATGNKQTGKMRQITLKAKMGAIYVDSSIELIQDGTGFAENLQTALVKSIGYGIDRYCIRGVGAGQPVGLLNSACKIAVSKEVGQLGGTIVYGNLKKMYARQLNPTNAVWLCNQTALVELLEQSVGVGTGGDFVPLLNEKDGTFRIFGRPVYFSSHLNALGAEGDIAFVDFDFYGLGMRQQVVLDITDAHRWTERERSFRVLIRFDGMCTLDKVVTPEHGDTLSPVVVVAVRA